MKDEEKKKIVWVNIRLKIQHRALWCKSEWNMNCIEHNFASLFFHLHLKSPTTHSSKRKCVLKWTKKKKTLHSVQLKCDWSQSVFDIGFSFRYGRRAETNLFFIKNIIKVKLHTNFSLIMIVFFYFSSLYFLFCFVLFFFMTWLLAHTKFHCTNLFQILNEIQVNYTKNEKTKN